MEPLARQKLDLRARRVLLSIAIVCGVLACALHDRQVDVHGWWSERGPVVPHDEFPADCSLCHAGGDWNKLRDDFHFDHEAETGVPLEGAHARAECLRCHNDRGPVALFAAKGCAGCHPDVHRGRLGSGCESCHETVDWRPREAIAQHRRTGFALIGAHAATACWRCHPRAEQADFLRTDTQCVSCHKDDLARATDPDHSAQGWVDDCERCHRPTKWSDAAFDHDSFPLRGRHRSVDCAECHPGGVFIGTPDQCVDCHLDDYDNTSDPDHMAAGFPTSCEQCHTPRGWGSGDFNHSFYPLTGRHARVDCAECHPGGLFIGTPDQCVDCHLDDYNNTDDPDHMAAGFPTSCDSCHTTNGWDGADFNHSFPIENGHHSRFDCSECHPSPRNFALFSCIDCHEHNQSDTDDDHDRVNGYRYNSAACYACHPNGND